MTGRLSKNLSAAPCCTACGSECIVKNGHNACGSAQFACRACGARRVLAPKRQPASAQRQVEVLRAVATERPEPARLHRTRSFAILETARIMICS